MHKDNSNITITPAKPEDARAIQEVYYKSWLATYPSKEHGITVEDVEHSYKDSFTEETIRVRTERLANLPDTIKEFVAKDSEKVIGICRIILHPGKNELKTIYLLPEYQGRGVGTMLWNEAVKCFDSKKDTIVLVATYNPKAIKFYEGLGFKDTGKRVTDERFRMKSGNTIPEMEMVIKVGI